GLATLYALNTLGAVAGSAAATFVLLERLGTRQTVWLAAAANLLVAALAASLAASFESGPGDATSEAELPALDSERSASTSPNPSRGGGAAPPAFLLMASGLVGFAFFVMELVWYRLLSPLLGGSVF